MSRTNCDVLLDCPDFASALDFYTGEAGFRLDLIYPADNPRIAELSGDGISVRLESTARPAPSEPPDSAGAIIQTAKDECWVEGRAGMQYRDLIPGRLGGQVIASHIRIPVGGPVADYVHYHQVGFQMIYCYRGWVRVVYEDQGDPFVMQAGDCVLQPPHIRHQVLESSDGLEVIEIGTPAEHETRVDHELVLPNGKLDPDREFDHQKFIFHQASRAEWFYGFDRSVETRDTGICDATRNLASAIVQRPAATNARIEGIHHLELYFNFVLSGSLELSTWPGQRRILREGDSYVIPAGIDFVQSHMSSDLNLLKVTLSEK